MITFKDKRSNEIKSAFSYREDGEKICIIFTKEGKEYSYNKNNIEILSNSDNNNLSLLVYELPKECYRCHKITKVLTYIIYNDGTEENVKYPWDRERLLKNQNILAHLQDSSIEYYGLNVVGDNEKYDRLLMERYPERIKNKYSQTQGRSYPMNVCCHCGSGQGWNFIYRDVNIKIARMEVIPVLGD